MSSLDMWPLWQPKLKRGMSFGQFLSQECAVWAWQPSLWQTVDTCRHCGSPCAATVKWMRKRECQVCPNGVDGGIP